MAVAVVQAVGKASAAAGTSLQLTGLSTSAGNLFLVAACGGIGDGLVGYHVSSVQDSASNGWALAAGVHTNSDAEIWTTTASSPSAITTVTVNQGGGSGGDGCAFWFYEISGANNTTPVDKSNTGTHASSTSASSGSSGTPAGSADLAIGLIAWVHVGADTASSITFTSGAGTAHANQGVGDGGVLYDVASNSLVLGAATAQTFSATLASGPVAGWGAVVVLIAAATAAAALARPNPLLTRQAVKRGSFY